jgi:OmpA-OmpF porin, OOP family
MMKNYLLIFACAFVMHLSSKGQNLVRNGCFDQQDPTSGCQNIFNDRRVDDIFAKFWSWSPHGGGTPDYFMPCSNMGAMNPLDNMLGAEPAKNGSAYVGFVAYDFNHTNYSEYLYHELEQPLEQGKTYNVEFYISLADKSMYSVKHIGMHLSYTNDPNVVSKEVFA